MNINNAIQRFLSWKLPKDFAPDAYISFDRVRAAEHDCEPIGTNLFNAEQTKAMLEHILINEDVPAATRITKEPLPWPNTTDAKVWADEFCKRNTAADHGTMLGWFANAIEFAKDHQREALLKPVKEQLAVQGQPGNWNYDSYMQGMYNGLECALATMEDREPLYRTKPTVGFICDRATNQPTEG